MSEKWIYSKNPDESLDECRQTQTSVDEPKFFTLIPQKVTHGWDHVLAVAIMQQ